MKRYLLILLAVLCAAASLPAPAQVAGGLMRFGTTGVFQPQAGDCMSILALTGTGQYATSSSTPCTPTVLSTTYTNATAAYTAVMALPVTQASTVVTGECTLIWESSSTSGTVTFGAGLSAAPTDLWSVSSSTNGAFVAPTYATITSTTTTAVTGALATTAATTPYVVKLSFVLKTSATAANTLTIYAESNSTSYTASVLPGSYCAWRP